MSEDGTPVPLDLTLHAADPDDATLAWSILHPPTKGDAVLRAREKSARLIYRPKRDANGNDAIEVTAADAAGAVAHFTIHVVIEAVNDAPRATARQFSTGEDKALDITLTGADPDGDALQFRVTDPPQHGRLTGKAPRLSYLAEEDFHGTDRFLFVVTDGELESRPAAITLSIRPENDPPRIRLTSPVTTREDESMRLTLSAQDEDPGNIEWSLVSPPRNLRTRWVTAVGERAALDCIPPPDWHGTDNLVIRAVDPRGVEALLAATLRVTPVEDRPTAENGTAATAEDEPVSITLKGGDPDGDRLSFNITRRPANGKLDLDGLPHVVYRPRPDLAGKDTFAFSATDGKLTSTEATVEIEVAAVNDPPRPVGPARRSVTMSEDGNPNPFQLVLAAEDPDGERPAWRIQTRPRHGQAALEPATAGTAEVIYQPERDYHGSDEFAVTAADAAGAEVTFLVAVTVEPVNDPPTARNLNLTTAEDTPLPLRLAGTDRDGDPLRWKLVAPPRNGKLRGEAPEQIFIPAPDYAGETRFSYRVGDGRATSPPAEVIITVTPENDAPRIRGETRFRAKEDGEVIMELRGSDVDDGPAALTWNVVPAAVRGVVSPARGTGDRIRLTYRPAADFSGSDRFGLTLRDAAGSTDSKEITIVVEPVNDAPEAIEATVTCPEDGEAAFELRGTDRESAELVYTIVEKPTHGKLDAAELPKVVYRPKADFAGNDRLRFRVSDGEQTAEALVTFEVAARNDAPVITRINGKPCRQKGALDLQVDEDAPLHIVLDATDGDGDAVQWGARIQGNRGTLDIAPRGASCSLRFTPPKDFHGKIKLFVSCSDGTEESSPVPITVTINPVNDPPVFEGLEEETGSIIKVSAQPKLIPLRVKDPEQTDVKLTATVEKGNVIASIGGSSLILFHQLAERKTDVVRVKADDGNGGVAEVALHVETVVSKRQEGPMPTVRLASFTADEVRNGIRIEGETFLLEAECTVQDPRGIRKLKVTCEGAPDYTPGIALRNGYGPASFTVSHAFRLGRTAESMLLDDPSYRGERFQCAIWVNDAPPFTFDLYRVAKGNELRQPLRMWVGTREDENEPKRGLKNDVKKAAMKVLWERFGAESGLDALLKDLSRDVNRYFFQLCSADRPARFNCTTKADLEEIAKQAALSRAGLYNKLFQVRGRMRQPIEWQVECSVRKPLGMDSYRVRFEVRDRNANGTGVVSFELPFYTDDDRGAEAFIKERLDFGLEILKQRLAMPGIPLGTNVEVGKETMTIRLAETAGFLPNMRLFFFTSGEVSGGAEPLSAPDGPYYQGIITRVADDEIRVQLIPSVEKGNLDSFRKAAKYAAVR